MDLDDHLHSLVVVATGFNESINVWMNSSMAQGASGDEMTPLCRARPAGRQLAPLFEKGGLNRPGSPERSTQTATTPCADPLPCVPIRSRAATILKVTDSGRARQPPVTQASMSAG